MGREIKRVPLDFDWPVGKIWPGYCISWCESVDDDCELCKQFMRLIGLEQTEHGCPNIPILNVPEGEGWQIWETVSEGSPVTPVFATPEELAKWCVENDNDNGKYGLAGPGSKPDYDGWMCFIKEGWAPSFVMSGGTFMSGVEACSILKD